jgi:hypothetical protein
MWQPAWLITNFLLCRCQTTGWLQEAVIDTIVAKVQGVPGDDRCVLLLGYPDQMEEMMREANPGVFGVTRLLIAVSNITCCCCSRCQPSSLDLMTSFISKLQWKWYGGTRPQHLHLVLMDTESSHHSYGASKICSCERPAAGHR